MSSAAILAIFFASAFVLIVIIESMYLVATLFFNYYPYEIPQEELSILSDKEKSKLNQYALNQYDISYEMSDVIRKLRKKDDKLKQMVDDLKFTNKYDLINKRLIKDLRWEINQEINKMQKKLKNHFQDIKNDFMGNDEYIFVKKNYESHDVYRHIEDDLNRHLINIFKMEEELRNID